MLSHSVFPVIKAFLHLNNFVICSTFLSSLKETQRQGKEASFLFQDILWFPVRASIGCSTVPQARWWPTKDCFPLNQLGYLCIYSISSIFSSEIGQFQDQICICHKVLYYTSSFQHRKCSSSHNSPRGIHSTPSSPSNILLIAHQPIPIAFQPSLSIYIYIHATD